ncbi:MAG: glycosyltransferase family 2 protein [Pseudomonadota bacterium]
MTTESVTNPSRILAVIVNFNGGEDVLRAIDSLLRQTHPIARIIVVDNASVDGSTTRIAERFPHVELLVQRENLGFAAANNLAVGTDDTSDWVFLLNPDAWAEPDCLQTMLRTAERDKAIDMVSCRLLNANDLTRLDGTGDSYHVSGLSWRRDHGGHANIKRGTGENVFSPCGAASLYRTSKWQQAGGFDERYFCYNEDVDLAFRLRLTGSQCVHVDEAVVHHIGSAVTGRESDFSIYHGHRNLVWTFFKNMPRRLMLRYLPQHIVLTIATLIYYTAKGRGRVIFTAKWHAIRSLPIIWRSRRQSEKQNPAVNSIDDHMVKGWLTPYFGRNRH